MSQQIDTRFSNFVIVNAPQTNYLSLSFAHTQNHSFTHSFTRSLAVCVVDVVVVGYKYSFVLHRFELHSFNAIRIRTVQCAVCH